MKGEMTRVRQERSPRHLGRLRLLRQAIRMNYGKTLLYILGAGGAMMVAITGICYVTGYFQSSNSFTGYAFLGLGLALTIYFLSKLRGQ